MTNPEPTSREDRASSPLSARVPRPIAAVGRAVHWRAAAREFVVILAGVLGALAAQAWWQNREQGGRERDYLRQLLSDTRENERRLDDAIQKDSVAGWRLSRLSGALYGARLVTADSTLTLFGGRTFSASDFQPLTGSYVALLASGDLRIIRTDTLRSQLVAYAARLDSERDKLQFFFAQAFGDPGRIARVLPFMRDDLVDSTDRVPVADRVPVDFGKLRRDPELASIVFSLQVANLNRLGHLRGMREQTVRLRRSLEAERGAGDPPGR